MSPTARPGRAGRAAGGPGTRSGSGAQQEMPSAVLDQLVRDRIGPVAVGRWLQPVSARRRVARRCSGVACARSRSSVKVRRRSDADQCTVCDTGRASARSSMIQRPCSSRRRSGAPCPESLPAVWREPVGRLCASQDASHKAKFVARAAWIDPAVSFRVPQTQVLKGYLRALSLVPLTPAQRVRCLSSTARKILNTRALRLLLVPSPDNYLGIESRSGAKRTE